MIKLYRVEYQIRTDVNGFADRWLNQLTQPYIKQESLFALRALPTELSPININSGGRLELPTSSLTRIA